MENYFQDNRALWNAWTEVHAKPGIYGIEEFLAGDNRLHQLERDELGDVSGKSLLHLQCHFGLDTLSWARLGASVTGLDFADKAIELARRLSEQAGIESNFVCSNLYDARENLTGAFDIVFTSYGAIGWLPDLMQWAEIIAHFLKPGGTFYIAEFHPFAYVFDSDSKVTDFQFKYPYFHGGKVISEQSQGSYADPTADVSLPEHGWDHSISEILNALIAAGLRIEFLHEFPFNIMQWFPFMEQREDGYWHLTKHENMIPMLYSIKATKPTG